MKHSAGAIIVAHCHPSGHAKPSEAGKLVTQRI
nr:JAB domain-containing protein [Serratia ureilytica]